MIRKIPQRAGLGLAVGGGVALVFVIATFGFTHSFTVGLLDPMINLLVVLNHALWGSFGLAVIAFTILVRLVTFPLTLRQLQQTRGLQALQPVVQDIQKKFTDPKRRQEEMMKAYRGAGVNPLGCLGPMVLQFPILIALFYAIRQTLAISPEALDNLSGHLYSWSYIQAAIPLEESFLWFDLSRGIDTSSGLLQGLFSDPNTIIVALVGLSTWAQSKTTVTVATDERARSQQRMMQWMLPIMFVFFSFNFPSGVSLYWVITSIVSVGFNVVTYGFPALNIPSLMGSPAPRPASDATTTVSSEGDGGSRPRPSRELRTSGHGTRRSKRKNRRRRA